MFDMGGRDETWWDQAELFVSILEPLVDLLKLCDSYVPMLGDIYEGTKRMLERNQELLEEKDPLLFGTIKDIRISRWNKYNTPLHALAYALNPKYYDEDNLAKFGCRMKAPIKDNEVANGFRTAMSKICSDPMEPTKLKNQFTSYITGSRAFGNENALADTGKLALISWWGYYSVKTPELQTLASRVLSQVCISSTTLRNWSTYGSSIQTKETNFNQQRQKILCTSRPSFKSTIKDIIISRWNKYNTPLQTLASALSPKDFHEA